MLLNEFQKLETLTFAEFRNPLQDFAAHDHFVQQLPGRQKVSVLMELDFAIERMDVLH